MNRDQKKVVEYIQSGSLLNLKTYLEKSQKDKKNTSKIVNVSIGKQKRTPLHIACLLGDDAIVRCLLKFGASVTKRDNKNNTPVHLAAKYIQDSGNYPDYKLLLNPLVEVCPESLHFKNQEKISPAETLKKARELYNLLNNSAQSEEECKVDNEKEWKDKLQTEFLQDLIDEQGRYEEYTSQDEEYNSFSQWADQIAADYKRRQDFLDGRKFRSKQDNRKRRKNEMEDLTKNLNKDYEQYVKQAKQMKKEIMTQKRERATEKMKTMKSTDNSDIKLCYNDIPWPINGNASDMAEVILSGIDSNGKISEQKRYILRQLVLWHPDKFEQRCGKNLHAEHRGRILNTVKTISQELNKFLDALKN